MCCTNLILSGICSRYMLTFTVKYVSKIAHEKGLSISEDKKEDWLRDKKKGRQTDRQRLFVQYAWLLKQLTP